MTHTPKGYRIEGLNRFRLKQHPMYAGLPNDERETMGSSASELEKELWQIREQLLAAARLTVLHFQREQAGGQFQGDDVHECWTALERAIESAERR